MAERAGGATRKIAGPTESDAAYLRRHRLAIDAAARRIAAHVRRTPTLQADLDPSLRLKPECFQVTGSFKARGAFNAVLRLRQQHPKTTGVITVSSGNHAQALALAARSARLQAVILIPHDANPAKVAQTRALGAEVLQQDITFANREERLREVMRERPGLSLVHPFDNWDVVHGQATAASELLEDEPKLAVLAAPCGGGGLLSGTALAVKARDRSIAVIGVEPEQADDAARTFQTGAVQRLDFSPTTLADGVRTVEVGPKTFEVMVGRRLVDAIVTVSEEEIAEATRVAWLRLKLALEPTGALTLAAHLAGRLPQPASGGTTGLILSGGNAAPDLVARLLST